MQPKVTQTETAALGMGHPRSLKRSATQMNINLQRHQTLQRFLVQDVVNLGRQATFDFQLTSGHVEQILDRVADRRRRPSQTLDLPGPRAHVCVAEAAKGITLKLCKHCTGPNHVLDPLDIEPCCYLCGTGKTLQVAAIWFQAANQQRCNFSEPFASRTFVSNLSRTAALASFLTRAGTGSETRRPS